MESKAQKAAIEEIRLLINNDILERSYEFRWDRIADIINDYGLKDRLDIIQPVYDALMKKEQYKKAASFAKKYGL
ncbi:MAG: hypothetical protein Q8K51_02610 [Nitrospirota bacterium]|nr:hypothetical protein [Nitrospirota bacterium]